MMTSQSGTMNACSRYPLSTAASGLVLRLVTVVQPRSLNDCCDQQQKLFHLNM
jgi:hypothetical protein